MRGDLPPEGALHFLDRLAPDGDLTFQSFDDGPDERPWLARILHGPLAWHRERLRDLNDRGAGIFFMVNRGDGRGRKIENVVGVRALFLDLDGASLEPVISAAVHPDVIVESSPTKYHCYWIVTGCALDRFAVLQRALAARFNGDSIICDLPRVMRIPKFWHRKREPFLTTIRHLQEREPHDVDDLVRRLELEQFIPQAPEPSRAPLPTTDGLRSRYAAAALDRAAHAITSAPNGRQNYALNRESFSIGQLVAAGMMPERLAHAVLLAAGAKMVSYNDGRPWLSTQIEAIVDRAFAQAATKPRRTA